MKLATVFDQTSIGNKLNYVIESTIPTITNFPIISKGSDWVRVNDILITQKNDRYIVTRRGVFLEEFFKRSWAVAYSVSLCQSNFSTCSILKANNMRLGKYLEEIERYNYHLDQAHDRGDYSKGKIISDRLSRTLGEYDLILEEVSPLIKSQVVV
jgi:hypothetical protein